MEERNVGAKEKSPKQDLTSAKDLVVVVLVLALYRSITTRRKYKGTSSMNYRERRSHARGVCPIQYTSRMGTARMKQEEGADTRIIVKE